MAHQIIDEFEYDDDLADRGFGSDDIIVDDPQVNDPQADELQVDEIEVVVSKRELTQPRLKEAI